MACRQKNRVWLFFAGLVIAAALMAAFPGLARAQCQNCGCVPPAHNATRIVVATQHVLTQEWVTREFINHRQNYLLDWWFPNDLGPAMQMMTEQLVSTAMNQIMAVGVFFDAKQQLETQRTFQRLTAQAHKDYRPGHEMCVIGTAARGLGASSRNAVMTALAISKRSQDRQMGAPDTMATAGAEDDHESRMEHFKKKFCDKNDMNANMESICDASSVKPETLNRDVDFTRTIDLPLTLDLDFSDRNLSEDEQAVLAMDANLFAHDVFTRVPGAAFREQENKTYALDLRSIIARRSVAQDSFSAIAGMKSAGTAASEEAAKYAGVVFKQLGVPADDVETLLGKRPSYYALMDVLTKKLYQRPEFYANLYESMSDTQRKSAALEAIGLMQDTDKFKSQLRNELMMSLILEQKLKESQDAVSDRLGKFKDSGRNTTE